MMRVLAVIIGVVAVVAMSSALFSEAPEGEDATDVVILMGQSNATYRSAAADVSTASPVPAPGTAFYYGTEDAPADFFTNASECGVWPISDAGGARIGDKWPSMAATYTEKTGRDVAMFELAKGGASITEFDPDSPTGWLWQRCAPMFSSAMSAFEDEGMTIGRISVVWIQGEADASMDPAEYERRLVRICELLVNGALGKPVDNPVWIVKTREARAPIQAGAELQAAADHPGIIRIASEIADTFTQANGLMADQSHYTQAGNNLVGSSAGSAIGEHIGEKAEKADVLWKLMILGVAIAVLGGTLLIFGKH